MTQEGEPTRMVAHYDKLIAQYAAQVNFYKALLYHEVTVKCAQAKGLKRQAAKIKRLQAQIAQMKKGEANEC